MSDDDQFGVVLLRPLAGEPAGPPRISVARAMRDGRRARRRPVGAAVAAVTATVFAGGALGMTAAADRQSPPPVLPPDPAVPAACTVDRLPSGRYGSAEVTAGDSSGVHQAGVAEPERGRTGPLLLWRDGELAAEIPRPAAGITINAINSSGVGVGGRDDNRGHPYAFSGGRFTRLPGGEGEADVINDAGVMAGVLDAGGGIPVRWAAPGAPPERLNPPAGERPGGIRIRAIAPDGTVAGRGGQGYLWLPDGTLRTLRAPVVDGIADTRFEPAAFHHGWLYGEVQVSLTSDGVTGMRAVPYRHDPSSGTWQALPGGNRAAQVAGRSFGGLLQDAPAVYVGRRILALPPYGPSVARQDAFMVQSASADLRVLAGTAASGRADPDAPYTPIIWHCG